MATKVLMGGKIRRLRRERGMTQVEMARRLDISPSYLNLIEHNQRPLTLSLLLNIGKRLGIDLETFSEDEESRLVADLTELLIDPLFRGKELAQIELVDMVAAAPGFCQEILLLYRAFRKAREDVRSLTERLSDDTFLSTSTHELRTFLTSIQSFSEILRDYSDIDSAERQAFVGVLVEESGKLTATINEMLDFAAAASRGGETGGVPPAEEVRDYVQSRGNYFPELELAAENLRASLDLESGLRSTKIAAELSRRHGVAIHVYPVSADAPGRWAFDVEQRRLLLSEILPQASRDFEIARHIGLLGAEDLLGPVLADHEFSSEAAHRYATGVLAGYFAAAILMPYDPFLEAARALRYDVDVIARRFDVSFDQACQRLTTLRRPGAGGVPLHYVRVDVGGNVIKQFSGSGIHVARFGGVCPRWNVHTAFLAPDRIDRQVARMPDGSTYFNVARAIRRAPARPTDPPAWYAVCIGCDIAHAHQLVYADGLSLSEDGKFVPVGVTCRLCERADCDQRVAPAIFIE
jgi:predicted transcriptional regulator